MTDNTRSAGGSVAKPVSVPIVPRNPVWRYLAVAGPGLVVAFADTEAGSITTAATSGAQFGMKLVLLQLLLIVPLFVVQEMTVRLGAVSGKGHAQLIRERYGLAWAWVSLGTMLVTNLAAIVIEFIGISAVATIFAVPRAPLIVLAGILLVAVVVTGKYRRVEIVALGLCALELLFIPAAIAAHPDPMTIVREGLLGSQPFGNREYLLLVAGNVGAVIMPWMIFYQQSAVVDKKLRESDLPMARIDTAIGAVATQAIMVAVIVACAATLFAHHMKVDDVAQAALALVPLTGTKFAGIAFGAGLLGASMLGALVVSLATAWAFGETFSWPCSLDTHCLEARRFYGLYAALVAFAVVIVLIPGLPLVKVTLLVMAFNAFVLPIVLGFLLVLANDKQILGKRVNSALGNTVAITVSLSTIALGIWTAFVTLTGG